MATPMFLCNLEKDLTMWPYEMIVERRELYEHANVKSDDTKAVIELLKKELDRREHHIVYRYR